jgi:hypothetical protein
MIVNCPPKRRLASFAATGLAALLVMAMVDPVAAKSRHRDREAKRDETTLSRQSGTPLLAIVSLSDQRVTIYDADGKILRAPVSTGQTGYDTPAGIYSVIQKEAEHHSNLYDDASMPFMQRITWSGIAMHAGALPGYPASHGCIRLPYGFAQRLFGLTKMGMRVIVMPTDGAPASIVHPVLFKPQLLAGEVAAATPPASSDGPKMRLGGLTSDSYLPPPTIPAKRLEILKSIAAAKQTEAETAARKADEARLAAVRSIGESVRAAKALRPAEYAKARSDAQLKSAEQALEAANSSNSPAAKERAEQAKAKAEANAAAVNARFETAKAEAVAKADAVIRTREEAKAAEAAKVAAANAAREATARMSPVSVFISREAQKLYVRQAFQPLFETPVTIRDADQPIGTHVYTALDYVNDGADVRWNVVTVPRGRGDGRRSTNRSAEPASPDAAGAKAALDRVTIPKETADRIAEVVSPGSSVIISDEPISKETGKGTDFVVLISGEPQGGIKIRKKPKPRGGDDEYSHRRHSPSPYGRAHQSRSSSSGWGW